MGAPGELLGADARLAARAESPLLGSRRVRTATNSICRGQRRGTSPRLSAQERSAAADCPYALFDLRFHDDAYWRSRLGEAWRVADEAAVEEDVAAFVRLALFYAWHLASMPKLGAQLWLGMAEPTAVTFRTASLERLPALAASEAANLSARWCTSTFYWRALACAAARGDSRRLRQVQLFGLQLGAARLLP